MARPYGFILRHSKCNNGESSGAEGAVKIAELLNGAFRPAARPTGRK